MFVSAHGNVFMREIAEHLVEALELSGERAELVDSELPHEEPEVTNLVVAPHEFFGLFPTDEAHRIAAARASLSINTEQPGTPFFDIAMRYARHGGVVLDINPFALQAVRRAGIAAVHLPLGVVRSMDAWGGARSPRPVDFTFMGGRTPRREAFIGGAGGLLWEWSTDLRFFSWHRPVRAIEVETSSFFAIGPAKYEALARSRIMLNIHRGDEPYFEWVRIVEAVANGCAIATETSVGTEPFVGGAHMLMAPLESLAEEAVALAFDEPRREAMADAAYEVLRRDLDQSVLLSRALGAARELVSLGPTPPVAARRKRGKPSVPWLRRSPDRSGITADQHVLGHTARTLKRAYLSEIANGRGIERALAVARFGDPDHAVSFETPAWTAAAADVSVVIPLFDQGHYLRDAVESVVACATGTPSIELVIVDDHSTDDSLGVAHALLDAHPEIPALLIARSANGGLPVARNTGFAAARGRYVFALDADNELYPSALRVLAAHLDHAPVEVAAAYGLLERFDETGSVGLTSHLPWDVELLVQGAFIDAMAMLRREAWEQLGGYASDLAVYGWEDYDLWLATAERGWRADLVPQIVGRYREQPGSMRRISDVDMHTNFVALRERHPRLPWPS